MNVRDIVGFVLLPLVLFLVAEGLRGFGVGGIAGFGGVGELGLVVAVALLIVGGTCLVTQQPPSQLSSATVVLVIITSFVVGAIGMLFRALDLERGDGADAPFGPRAASKDYPYSATIRVLIEFTLVLFILFAVPRMGKKRGAED